MTIKFNGNSVQTNGELPSTHAKAPDFHLVKTDLSTVSLNDFAGKKLVLNIFPSIDTSTCATSVRKFNQQASALDNTQVLCIARDLPFAMRRFCGAEGLDNVIPLSDFKAGKFGKDYGLEMTDGPFAGLHARVVIVIDADQHIVYQQLVPEISDEPDYESALAAL